MHEAQDESTLIHAIIVDEDTSVYQAEAMMEHSSVITSKKTRKRHIYIIAGFLVVVIALVAILVGVFLSNEGKEASQENPGSYEDGDHDDQTQTTMAPTPENEISWVSFGKPISDGVANGHSGSSVALNVNGTVVAFGSPGDAEGRVRLYSQVGKDFALDFEWKIIGQPLAGDSANDEFGTAISLDSMGSTIAVGAPGKFNNSGSISVYTFNFATGRWDRKGQELSGFVSLQNTAVQGTRVGEKVALSRSGEVLAGSSPFGHPNGTVLVYNYVPGSQEWFQLGSDLIGANLSDEFGASVALNGNGAVVVIGAPNAGSDAQGEVYVAELDSETGRWTQLGSTLTGESPRERFGSAVDITSDGSRIVVGAHRYDNGRGKAQVYEYGLGKGGNWFKVGNDITGTDVSDQAGFSVSIADTGAVVVVGQNRKKAPFFDREVGATGVYTFGDNTGRWERVGRYLRGLLEGDEEGHSVASSSTGAIIATGAPFSDVEGINAGLVRVYANANELV
jgi:hypothetical protein